MRQILAHLVSRLDHCRKLNNVTFCLLCMSLITFYVMMSNVDKVHHGYLTDSNLVLLQLSKCGCQKYVPRSERPLNPQHKPLNGTCSLDTWPRGAGQKVIGFTFYQPVREENGTEDKSLRNYFQGIQDNLTLMKEKYGPEWILRLYYQVQPDSPVMKQLCDLACSQPNLDLCDAEDNPRLGNASILYPLIWRFLPAMDVNVDLYLSRDLDSRINDREIAAVNEFLKSDKALHVMRDHPAHSTYILGGTWGAKINQVRQEMMSAFKKLFKDGLAYIPREKGGGYDQIALTRYIWPWAKKVALSHDSYTCHKFSKTSAFPTQRVPGIGNFIGSVVSLNQSLGFDVRWKCPEKCRPKNHPDWIYC